MRRHFVIPVACICGLILFLSSCSKAVPDAIDNVSKEATIFQMELYHPLSNCYKIQLTEQKVLTVTVNDPATPNVVGDKKSVLLSDHSFQKVYKELNQLNASAPPKTLVFDGWNTYLTLSENNQQINFAYCYSIDNRKTDKPYIDFTRNIVKLSPIPIVDSSGHKVRPYVTFFLIPIPLL